MDNYQETFETWNKVAAAYQDKFMAMDLYNDTYSFFCDATHKLNARVLEIGCGPGNITKYLLNKRPDLEIEGIDIAENMIALAKINNPAASFRVMDCRYIDKLNTKFDGIICGFCIPYLSKIDVYNLIKNCVNLLQNGGLLYLSFVEGDSQNSGYQTSSSGHRLYFHFYALQQLTTELKQNGFEITRLFYINYPKSATANETHTVIIAKK